jgi:hypothetical protein
MQGVAVLGHEPGKGEGVGYQLALQWLGLEVGGRGDLA